MLKKGLKTEKIYSIKENVTQKSANKGSLLKKELKKVILLKKSAQKILHTGDKESLNHADSRTDTILERLRDLSNFLIFILI